GRDPGAVFLERREALIEERLDPGLAEHLLEDEGGDVGLELEAVGAGSGLLGVGAVLLRVVVADAVEELARIAADAAAVPGVGGAEAAADHAAHVAAGLEEQNGFSFASGRNGRDHAS